MNIDNVGWFKIILKRKIDFHIERCFKIDDYYDFVHLLKMFGDRIGVCYKVVVRKTKKNTEHVTYQVK